MASKKISTTVNATSIQSLEEEYLRLYGEHEKNIGSISDTISFSDAGLEEAKDQLAEFVIRSKELANRQTFKERTLRKISHLPFGIGNSAAEAVKDIRKERLNDKSITEVVDALYYGIKKRADNLETTIHSMFGIQEKTMSLVESLAQLDKSLDEQMSADLDPRNRLTVTKLSSQVKLMLSTSQDKVQELSVIINVAQAVLMNMIKVIPVTKSELLSRIVMDAGVSQINAIHQDVKDVMELNHTITEDMNEKTRKAIIGLLESSSVSQKDVDRIKKSTDDRIKLMTDIAIAAQKFETNLHQTHLMIVDNVNQANEARAQIASGSQFLLSSPSSNRPTSTTSTKATID